MSSRCYNATRKLPLPKSSPALSHLFASLSSSNESVTPCKQKNPYHLPVSTSILGSRINGHQRGHGKLVALSSKTAASIRTHLSELRHSSPMRLVPSRRTHPAKRSDYAHQSNGCNRNEEKLRQEAALVHLSSYGGGLVPGDSLDLEIEVRGKGAAVCVLTQGGQRIYRPGKHFRRHAMWSYHNGQEISNEALKKDENGNSHETLCTSNVHCIIEPGATLFYLPDPTVPYYQSSFQETRKFFCQFSDVEELGTAKENMGSLVAVDWYSCGRRFSTGMETEQWAFDHLATRTELFVERQNMKQSKQNDKNTPLFIESMSLRNRLRSKKSGLTPAALSMGQNHDAVATLLLHGPLSQPVAKRAHSLSRHFAGLRTRIRDEDFQHKNIDFDSSDGIRPDEQVGEMEKLRQSLGGSIILSINPVRTLAGEEIPGEFLDEEMSQTQLVRILAESNEDIYRILHHCLKPCSELLSGFEPYKDRIHSSKTVRRQPVSLIRQKITGGVQNGTTKMLDRNNSDLDQIAYDLVYGNDCDSVNQKEEAKANAWFRMSMLSDSALPVGSFAHSLGVEAASQMRVFEMFHEQHTNEELAKRPPSSTHSDSTSTCSVEALSNYVYAASRSNAQLSTPFILAGYYLLAPSLKQNSPFTCMSELEQILKSWDSIDQYLDSMLQGNGPGRRASMDQGLGLLRVSSTFIDHSEPGLFQLWELMRKSIDQHHHELFSSVQPPKLHGHAFPIYGMLSASMGLSPLDSCRIYSFGAARDAVSAAVRLNLIGPMAGLALLDDAGFVGVNEGLEAGLLGMLLDERCRRDDDNKIVNWLKSAATCAPMLDAIQPCHDILSVRLFRT
ncbi:hypothetical protein ACHAXS_007995 [Conticribra weissflogii]